MIGPDPSKISSAHRLADTIIRERDLEVPVPVEALVRDYADLRAVPFEGLSKVDALVHGLQSSDRPTVLLNAAKPSRRQRFTLGHELGHISMAWHIGTISCHASTDDAADEAAHRTKLMGESSQLEREADVFASRLLVPSRFVATLDLTEPGSMLDELQRANVSPAAGMHSLVAQLPPGFAFALLNGATVEASAESYGTVNLGFYRGQDFDSASYSALADRSGIRQHHGRTVWWGLITSTRDLTTSSPEWRPIWEQIRQAVAPGEGPGSTLNKRAMAVTSSAHNDVGHDDLPLLAQRIRLHFLRREHLVRFVDHPLFDDFASARAVAFALGIKRTTKGK